MQQLYAWGLGLADYVLWYNHSKVLVNFFFQQCKFNEFSHSKTHYHNFICHRNFCVRKSYEVPFHPKHLCYFEGTPYSISEALCLLYHNFRSSRLETDIVHTTTFFAYLFNL
jgi:hypothetical protein